MIIQFQTRQGQYVNYEYTRAQAVERLAYLRAQEELTRQVAPTDSGDVRFNHTAERRVIEQRLGR